MLTPIPYQMDVLRGREALHIQEYEGAFALCDDLNKQKLLKGTLYVAIPGADDGSALACGLIKYLTKKKIEPVFCGPTDTSFCKADFVLSSQSPLFYGKEEDSWEIMLSIVLNTPWVKKQFDDPIAFEWLIHSLWVSNYEDLADINRLGLLSNASPKAIFVDKMMYAHDRMARLFRIAKGEGNLIGRVRNLIRSSSGYIVLPDNARGLGYFTARKVVCLTEQDLARSNRAPIVCFVYKEAENSWQVYPAVTLSETTGAPCPKMSIKAALNNYEGWKECLDKLYAEYVEDFYGSGEYFQCSDKHAAVELASWLVNCFHGTNTEHELETIVGLYDGIPK